MSDFVFSVKSKSIVYEVIEGEAVILNMDTGEYFSTDGLGAEIWQNAVSGHSLGALIDSANAAYVEHDMAAIIDGFLADAEAKKVLVREKASTENGPTATASWNAPFAPPELIAHAQVGDLMELDPIHEVEQEAGWPLQPADTEEAAEPEWPTRNDAS